MLYVVTAATSTAANGLCGHLREKGHYVRAVVRDPTKPSAKELTQNGVEVVQGSYDDVKSLENAFSSATGVFVLLPPCWEKNENEIATQYSQNICTAVKNMKVPRIVALSSMGSELEHGTGSLEATHILEKTLDEQLEDQKIVILRATYFLENWKDTIPRVVNEGILTSFICPEDLKIPQIAARDIAQAAARYLMISEIVERKTIVELLGAQQLSPRDIADILSRLLNKPVKVECVTDDQLEQVAKAILPFDYIDGFVQMTRAMNNRMIQYMLPGTVQKRGTTTAEEFFKTLL